MKRKLVYLPVIIIITGLIIAFSLIINNSIISTRIYYKINYKGNVQNFESILKKVSYLNMEIIVNIATIGAKFIT